MCDTENTSKKEELPQDVLDLIERMLDRPENLIRRILRMHTRTLVEALREDMCNSIPLATLQSWLSEAEQADAAGASAISSLRTRIEQYGSGRVSVDQ